MYRVYPWPLNFSKVSLPVEHFPVEQMRGRQQEAGVYAVQNVREVCAMYARLTYVRYDLSPPIAWIPRFLLGEVFYPGLGRAESRGLQRYSFTYLELGKDQESSP